MTSEEVALTLLTRVASAERELARRRMLALRHVSGRPTRLMWHTPEECVALLARHGEPVAGVVTEVLGRGASLSLPRLEGCEEGAIRAARGRWMRELAALARGEAVTVTELPTSDEGAAGTVEPEPPVGVDGGGRRARSAAA